MKSSLKNAQRPKSILRRKKLCLCTKCKKDYFSFDRKHIGRYVNGDYYDLTHRKCNNCARSEVLTNFLNDNKEFNALRCKNLGNNPESHEKVELRNKSVNRKKTYLYIAKIDDNLYKIGITLNLESRKSHMHYLGYYFTILLKNRYIAAKMEREIKERFCDNGELFPKRKLKKICKFLEENL